MMMVSRSKQLSCFVRAWDTTWKIHLGKVIRTTNTFLSKFLIHEGYNCVYLINQVPMIKSLMYLILIECHNTERHYEVFNVKLHRTWLNDNSVPVVMDNMRCGEDVKDISECRYISMSHNCDHSEDIWLQCKGNRTTLKIRVTIAQ